MRTQTVSAITVVREGNLVKSPPDRIFQWLSNKSWKLRHFVLKSGNHPGSSCLEYFDPKNSKLKGTIDLDQCDQVDAYLRYESKGGKQNHKWIFDVRLPHRTYYLAAQSEVEMNGWVADLCRVCNLQPSEEPGEMDTPDFSEETPTGRRQSAPGGTVRSRTTTESSSSRDGNDPTSPGSNPPGTLPRNNRHLSNNSVSSPTGFDAEPNRRDLPPKPPRLAAASVSITSDTTSKPSTPVSLRSLPPVPGDVPVGDKKAHAYDHLKEMWSGPHPAHVEEGPPNSPPPPLPPEFANLEFQNTSVGMFSASDSCGEFEGSNFTGISTSPRYKVWQERVNGSISSSVESLSTMSHGNSTDVLHNSTGQLLDMVIPPRPPKIPAMQSLSGSHSYHNGPMNGLEEKGFGNYDRPPIPRYNNQNGVGMKTSSSDCESHPVSSGFGSLPRGPLPIRSKEADVQKSSDRDKMFRSLPRPPVRKRTPLQPAAPTFSLPTPTDPNNSAKSSGMGNTGTSQPPLAERKASSGLPRTSSKNLSGSGNHVNTMGDPWYESGAATDNYNNLSFGNASSITGSSQRVSDDAQHDSLMSRYDTFSFPNHRRDGFVAPPVDRTLKPRTKPRLNNEPLVDDQVNYQNKELQPRLPVKIQPKQSFKRRPLDNQLSSGTLNMEAGDILSSHTNGHSAISKSPRFHHQTKSSDSETDHEIGRLEYLDVNLPPSALPSPMLPQTPNTPNGLGRSKATVEYKQVDPIRTRQFNKLKMSQERSYLTDNSRSSKGASRFGPQPMDRR